MEAEPLAPPPLLQVRLYGEALGDYQLINGWWHARHKEPLAETILPPLGVIIMAGGEPIAALWAYECFGVGVCFLEHPITRPGLSIAQAKAALRLAIEACVQVAKSHGDFALFKCYTIPGIAHVLPRLGFQRCTTEPMTGFILRRD
jgi:hypothetical protein